MQAHDFEAYQEMLRETAPPGSSTERFEVISKFLTTTEEYLNKLSSKVASVKMTQEASEAAALAVSKARAQVTKLSTRQACPLVDENDDSDLCTFMGIVKPGLNICAGGAHSASSLLPCI